jgi:hypothetical protein
MGRSARSGCLAQTGLCGLSAALPDGLFTGKISQFWPFLGGLAGGFCIWPFFKIWHLFWSFSVQCGRTHLILAYWFFSGRFQGTNLAILVTSSFLAFFWPIGWLPENQLQGKYLGGKQKKKKQVDLPFRITASLFRGTKLWNKNTYKYNLVYIGTLNKVNKIWPISGLFSKGIWPAELTKVWQPWLSGSHRARGISQL